VNAVIVLGLALSPCSATDLRERPPQPTLTGTPVVAVEFQSELLWVPRFLLYPDGTIIGTTPGDIESALKRHQPVPLRYGKVPENERERLVQAVQTALQNGGARYRVERHTSETSHYVLSSSAESAVIDVGGRIEGFRGRLNRLSLPHAVREVLGSTLGVTFNARWPVAQFAVRLKPWMGKQASGECTSERLFPFLARAGNSLIIGINAGDSGLVPWFERCTYVRLAGGNWEYFGYEPVVPGWPPFVTRGHR